MEMTFTSAETTTQTESIQTMDEFIDRILGRVDESDMVADINAANSLTQWLDALPYQDARYLWEDVPHKMWRKHRVENI